MERSLDLVDEEKKERVVKCRIETCSTIIHSSYYKKYRLCADHAKAPEILHRGILVRFCQKCSRLHRLEAFEGKRRSCKQTLESNRIRRRQRYHASKSDRMLDRFVAEEKDNKSECSSKYGMSGEQRSSKAVDSDQNDQNTGFIPVGTARPRPGATTTAPDTPQELNYTNPTNTGFHPGQHPDLRHQIISEQEALVVLSSIENILHLIKDLFEAIVPKLPIGLQPGAERTMNAFKALEPTTLPPSLTQTTSEGAMISSGQNVPSLPEMFQPPQRADGLVGGRHVLMGPNVSIHRPEAVYVQPLLLHGQQPKEKYPFSRVHAHDLNETLPKEEVDPLVILSQKLFGCRPEELPQNVLPELCQTLTMAPNLIQDS